MMMCIQLFICSLFESFCYKQATKLFLEGVSAERNGKVYEGIKQLVICIKYDTIIRMFVFLRNHTFMCQGLKPLLWLLSEKNSFKDFRFTDTLSARECS